MVGPGFVAHPLIRGPLLYRRQGQVCGLRAPTLISGHGYRARLRCCASPVAKTDSRLETVADIAHDETDALIAAVRNDLNNGTSISEATIQDMVVHLADSRGMARLGLVDSFGRIGPIAVPAILHGLKVCPNPVVRRSCGKALAKIGDSSATDALIDTLLNDEDTVTRSSAAGALAKMGESAVPKLLSVISSSESNMTAKGHAAWAISFMQGQASAALLERAQDPNRDVRLAVVSALGSIAIGDALPSMSGSGGLEEALDDWDEDGDAVVAQASAELRGDATRAMVIALDDECPEVRAEATTALANAGIVEQAPRILEFLKEKDIELRRTAALALMKLRYVDAIDALNQCANDPNEVESVQNVARLAANSLAFTADVDDDDW